jgi:hypothetical protein
MQPTSDLKEKTAYEADVPQSEHAPSPPDTVDLEQRPNSEPPPEFESRLPPPPDGGLHAWLKVFGGFLIYINIWSVVKHAFSMHAEH